MTALVDIVNESLQKIGTRTNITATELTNNSSNEAIQANLVATQLRDRLLRMAPWNCSTNMIPAVLITAAAGTPENPTQATTFWARGQPTPPWSYEYQYPVDCLRPLMIVPQFTPGAMTGGIPITTAVTGWFPLLFQTAPVRFKVNIDQFFPLTGVTINSGGSGHAVGDIITLPTGPLTAPPIGAPAQLQVVTTGGGGAITSINIVNQVAGEPASAPLGGSYFTSNPYGNNTGVAQGTTTGVGTGATFNLTNFGPLSDQRVITTNQENALLSYVRQVVDPNVMDQEFVDAWTSVLGARLAMALTGDKTLANLKLQEANVIITEARKVDGNEGLTVNDVTPDWIRIRGIDFNDPSGWSPNIGFDWGALFTLY